MGPSGSFFFFCLKIPWSHFHGCIDECSVVPPWMKVCIISLFSLEKHDTIHSCFLTSLSFFRCWRVRHIGSHSSQTDRLKCSTLQGQSLRCYSRRMTSYESLWCSTTEKLFSWHLVCHAFLSITFAFRSCSRSVEVLYCWSDRRQTGKSLENPFELLTKPKTKSS